jgi:large subunit ribosomal protein L13
MNKTTNQTVVTIDAAGRAIGRVASEAAMNLRNKLSPSFEPHIAPKVRVKIVNAAKLKLVAKKMSQTRHTRYTGYPGGLRQPTQEQVIAKHGASEPLRLAIKGMLPRNKLRAIMMTHLEISE